MVAAAKLQKLFGSTVRAEREAAGLSQEGLALEAKIDRSFVSQIERGEQQPSLTTIWKLAGTLGIPTSTLLQRTEKALAGP